MYILQSMTIASLEAVTQETVINCFEKAGITSEAQCAAIATSKDPFKNLQESLEALKSADLDIVPEGLFTENVIDIDHDVIATAPFTTEDNI